ncbi:MAG: hypothetical protein IJQ58_00550 [Synergistaceae bacterium]|nr:hypothetical protein [Synergistaceae bacterium]
MERYLVDMEDGSKRISEIIMRHAAAAGVAAMASGVLPGIGALISSVIGIGAIWHMYYAIGQYLHLEFSKDILKAIASAIIVNIVTQLAGVITMEILASFVPGLAIITNGICLFGVTYIAGLLFLKALVHIFKAGGDPSKMTAQEIESRIKEAAREANLRDEFRNAKSTFKQMRKEGTLNEQSRGVDINSD